jgi:hypothetical protein
MARDDGRTVRCPRGHGLLPADSVERLCPHYLLRPAIAKEPNAPDTLPTADGADAAVEHESGAYQIVRLLGGPGFVFLTITDTAQLPVKPFLCSGRWESHRQLSRSRLNVARQAGIADRIWDLGERIST